MNPYLPLPNDTLTKGGDSLHVERVFPTQVVFYFSSPKFSRHSETVLSRTEFDAKAQNSFNTGAVLIRDGQQIYPPMITAPLSGSHNTHARLSPSDSKRWTNCTASIAFQEANAHRINERESSAYADEGTQAHDWAANALTGKISLEGLPPDFREPVGEYVEYCQSHLPDAVLTKLNSCIEEAELGFDPPEQAFFVEEEIPLFYQPEQHGTADFIALQCEDGVVTHLWGNDYKHGVGVLVTAEESTQLAIYIYSAITRLQGTYTFSDDTLVTMSIVQPRHRESHEQKPWVIRLADLRTFCEEITSQASVARAAADAVRPAITGADMSCADVMAVATMAEFCPSEGDAGACRWCKCKAFCSARLAANTEGMDLPTMDAAEMLSVMPELDKKMTAEERIGAVSEILGSLGRVITDEYLVSVVARKSAITAFLNDAEEYLETRLLSGEIIEGVKLVDGREGNRDWASEEQAETFLRNQGLKLDERATYKLKSPAQVEKLIKDKLKTKRTKNRFEELIVRSPAQKKIAISADKRDAVSPALTAMPEVDDFEV